MGNIILNWQTEFELNKIYKAPDSLQEFWSEAQETCPKMLVVLDFLVSAQLQIFLVQ